MKQYKIPRIPDWFLKRLYVFNFRDGYTGDIEEEFEERVQTAGERKAVAWIWFHAITGVPIAIKSYLICGGGMIRNYLKITFRNIRRHKGYSFINISGLAMGLAIFTLLAIIVGFNTEADRFHKNADRIYSVVQVHPSIQEGEEHTAFTPYPLLSALQNEFPEIDRGTRAFPAGRMIVKQEDKIFYENRILFADPQFLSIFSFDLLAGDPSEALAEPFSIVLSKDIARKYFGDTNPMGKVLMLNNEVSVTVKGILDFIDDNYSSIYFESLVSLETASHFKQWRDDWKTNRVGTFLLLSGETNPTEMEGKFPYILEKYYPSDPKSPKRLYLLSLLDFRLHSDHIVSFWHSTESFLNYTLMITGILILFIVSINFVNLSTARYMNRIKEVGLRKVVGARKLQLMKQFLSESVILALIALPLSLVIYYSMLHVILRLLVHYQGEFSVWNHPFLYKYLVGVAILVGIFAGAYPAFFLSSFHPAKIIKGNIRTGRKGSGLRKLLVISQFAVTIILIIVTLAWKQLHDYFFTADMGYNRENIVTVKLTETASNQTRLLRDGLRRHSDIVSVSATADLPISWSHESFVIPEGLGEAEALDTDLYDVDYDFTKTLAISLQQGRRFSRDFNDPDYVMINNILSERLNWTDPIGRQLTIDGDVKTVVGVTDYFHFKSVNLPSGPAVLRLNSEQCNYLLVKFSSSSNTSDVIAKIREAWHTVAPDMPFESDTLENYFYNDFSGDRTFLIIFGFIVGIAIFVSCLGLLGMASYAVQRRTKEIGIRKTLGASIAGIVRLLMGEFFLLVFIANIIGMSASHFICKSLFQYRLPHIRIPVGVEVYVITALITLFTAAVSVTAQTLRAANANPVDSLRYE